MRVRPPRISSPDGPTDPLGAELEARLLRHLASEWETINWQLFDSRLRPVVLELTDTRARLGQWDPATRSISLSRSLVLERPWVETLEVLKHEMAHQFVSEVLGDEATPHGPRFREVCRDRGIDPAATQTRTTDPRASTTDRVVARVRKLLALAESSNQHEAELAAATAARLMLKFNIEVDRADPAATERCRSMWLGTPTGRLQPHHRKLAEILIAHFFVQGIWVPVYRPREGKTGTVLEICGRPENLEMAEFVHAFLSRAIERLWTDHKRRHQIRSDRDRRSFLAGALEGFRQKLQGQQAQAQRAGLVWSGGQAELAYLERRYPRRRGARGSSRTRREGYEAGKRAGRDLVLHRPVERDGGPSRGRSLPPAECE